MAALRLLLRLVAGVVVVAVVAVAVVYGLLRSSLLTGPLDQIITLLARKPGVFFVRAEGVSGDLPEHLRVRKVEVGDYYGVWLTVEDAEATWHPFDLSHPFDLVKWRINVDDVHAARVEWTRLPRDGPGEVDTPFHWDRFIRIIVGHISVDDFDLSGSILGGGHARVRAEGSGVLGEWDHGFVRLDIAHVDDCPGKATIDLKTGGSPLELSGTISAEEGPGGALAALARIKDAGAVRLEARASGAMRDWHAEAEVTASNVGALHARTGLSFTAAGPFEVTGSFDPVASQRERWLVGQGAPISLFAKGAWAPDVELRLDRVLLTADGRELSADGKLDLASRAFHVGARLARESHEGEGESVTLTLLDVASARLDTHGVLGDGGNLEATLDLSGPSAHGVSARDLHAALKASDPRGDGAPSFELTADASGVARGDGPAPLFGEQAHLEAGGHVDLAAGLLAAERLRLEGSDLVVEGPVSFRDDWRSMRASLHADAATLESLTRVARTSVSGSASANIEIEAKSDWKDLHAKVSASAADVAIGEAGWNALLAGSSTLEADLSGAPHGPAHGEVTLKTAGIDVSAKADAGAGGKDLVGDAHLVLDNLARLAQPARAAIAGRLEATASARGTLDEFDLEVGLRGDRFSYEGSRFDSLTADVEAVGLPHAWSGKVRSRAKYGKLDASLDAAVSMPDNRHVVVRGLALRGPRTEGSADLDVDLDAAVASGKVRLKSDDLSLWRPMTGTAIGGAVDLDATLAASPRTAGGRATQQVSGTATIRKGDFAVGDKQLFIDGLEASAAGLEIGASPRGSATVHASQVRYEARTLVDGVASVSGDGRLWNIQTNLHVRDTDEMHLDAAATLLPGPPLELTLSRASGELGGTSVALLEPARLRVGAAGVAGWSVAPLALGVGKDGRLSGAVSSAAGKVHIEAEATSVPLDVVSVFAPTLDLIGSIDGKLAVDAASFATASGELSLRGHDVASAGLEAEGVAPVDLEANGRIGKGRISGSASVVGLTNTRLAVTLDAPVGAVSGSEPFRADLTWKGDLGEAVALLPIGEDTVAGLVDADLHLTGTVAAPRVTGRAVIDGGRWEHGASGLVLRDIHAEFEGDGTSLDLKKLAATDGEKGTVSAQGYVRFGSLPAFDAALDVEATNAMLARLDLITMRADAKLALKASRTAEKGAAIGGSISGSVRIADARVEIPQRFIADVPEIEVTEVGAAGEGTGGQSAAARRAVLALDMTIIADNRIFVTGRGLESEWSSDLHLRGDTSDPRLEGKVSSVRGQLSLIGRRFDISSAILRFDGQKGNVAYLTLTARAEANDITAIAEVTGPATRPVVELRSEPALPRDEVLSRVLFGQSAANLTPLQSVELARSVAELTGSPLAGGGDIISGVGRTLGFDRLGIESAGSSGAAALTASRYLTDKVYLRVQGGLTPEASKLSLEWRVLKHITIESDVSQDAQGEVGATWKWDY